MHQVSEQVQGIAAVEFGFNLDNLYVRVDGTAPVGDMVAAGFGLGLRFLSPVGLRIEIEGIGNTPTVYRKAAGDQWLASQEPGVRAAVGRVAEFEIPFAALGAGTGERVAMFVILRRGPVDVDRQPRNKAIEFEVPDQGFTARSWTV
jgi:hypothetical protein